MNSFNLLEASAPNPLAKWVPPLGGLLAAGAVAWLMCRLPLRHLVSWGDVFGSATEYLLAAFLASAATVWGLCVIRPGGIPLNARRLILRTSLDALWLAPLGLFLCQKSPWAIAAATVLVASVTKSFRLHQGRSDEAGTEESLDDIWLTSKMFGLTDSSLWLRRLFSALCVSVFAQAAVLVGFTGRPFAAAVLIAVSSAVLTWSFTAESLQDDRQFSDAAESPARMLLALTLAVVFTTAGLARYMENTSRLGGLGVPFGNASRHGLSPWERHGQVQNTAARLGQMSKGPSLDLGDVYSGIVLWPKKQTYTTLVAPAPALGNNFSTNSRSATPLVIPFNGVYWFFKAPDVGPPRGSHEAHGSPEALDIRSTDRRGLSMEAHQNFGTLIDVDCCSKIQIAIRNADRYRESVSLELILFNTSLPGKPSQSLGRMMVTSTRPWKLYDDRPPVGEVLSFDIPANPTIHRFDEAMIVFRLDADRADAGARIAIERFVLVPRGL